MSPSIHGVIVVALADAGCILAGGPAHPSAAVDGARTLVAGDLQTASQELTRLFSRRGFTLAGLEPMASGLELVYRGVRWHDDGVLAGSSLYVRVAEAGPRFCSVTMYGRPAVGDEDLCTPVQLGHPCTMPSFGDLSAPHEAETILGVLAELELDGQIAQ